MLRLKKSQKEMQKSWAALRVDGFSHLRLEKCPRKLHYTTPGVVSQQQSARREMAKVSMAIDVSRSAEISSWEESKLVEGVNLIC